MKAYTVTSRINYPDEFDKKIAKVLNNNKNYELVTYEFSASEYWLAGSFIFTEKNKPRTGGKSGKKIS